MGCGRRNCAPLQDQGPDQRMDRNMIDALDRAGGSLGEGPVYCGVRRSLELAERRHHVL